MFALNHVFFLQRNIFNPINYFNFTAVFYPHKNMDLCTIKNIKNNNMQVLIGGSINTMHDFY